MEIVTLRRLAAPWGEARPTRRGSPPRRTRGRGTAAPSRSGRPPTPPAETGVLSTHWGVRDGSSVLRVSSSLTGHTLVACE
jgi:hypothetical protein